MKNTNCRNPTNLPFSANGYKLAPICNLAKAFTHNINVLSWIIGHGAQVVQKRI